MMATWAHRMGVLVIALGVLSVLPTLYEFGLLVQKRDFQTLLTAVVCGAVTMMSLLMGCEMIRNPLFLSLGHPTDQELARLLVDPAIRARIDRFLERERRGELGPGIPHEEVRQRLGFEDDDEDDDGY